MVLCAAIGGAAWYAVRAYRKILSAGSVPIPTAQVLRGDVTLSVTARGELRGGNSEALTAPLTGGVEGCTSSTFGRRVTR